MGQKFLTDKVHALDSVESHPAENELDFDVRYI
jgi:hypothetical protein